MDGLQDLIRYLGERPGDRDVPSLARRFGLDERTVALAVGRAQGGRRPRPAKRAPSWGLGARLNAALELAAAHPRRSVFALCCVVALLVVVGNGFSQADTRPNARGLLMAAVLLLSVPTVSLVVYRVGRVRLAVLAAVGLAVALAFPTGLAAPLGEGIGPMLALFVVATVLGLALLVPTASLGGYIAARNDERDYQQMDRQQALVRLIELRQLLADAGNSARPPDPTERLRRWVWATAPASAFLLRLVGDLLLGRIDSGRVMLLGQSPSGSPQPILLLLAFQLASLALVFLAGYLARRVPAGMALGVAMELAGWASASLPSAYVPLRELLASGAGPIAASFVFPVVAGATGGMAGRAYEHLRTAALRASNDRDVLTAEMIDLEWRLRPGDRHVCALVVDVAGSTKMKAGADPLVVEMCFREYQNWVGATAVAHGGEVASRAGDGAVLAFEREDDAIAAGLALQAGLARFNAESNRLDNPFRLRIGIHCGEIAGDLAEVEYTGVIDGAAHVESMAPIGGVAVTATAAHRAHGWRFSPIGQQFQGNEVLVVLGPSQLRNEPVQPAV